MKMRYSPNSPYVRKCMVLALETGIAGKIEKLPASTAPTNPNKELAQDNPLAKIPALITDDGQALFDSPVICEYLDSQHGGNRVFPAEGKARWTALRQQALGDGILDAALLGRYEMTRPEEKRWKDWSEGQMFKIRSGLDALEADVAALSGPLTIGQITVGCALGYLDFRYPNENWRAAHPRLAAWYDAFAKRPAMKETVPPGP
jgi:glutathione S-transferase